MKPQSELVYFNTDDGIWVVCQDDDQHWRYNLGFSASVMDAMEVWHRHLDAAHLEEEVMVREVQPD